jgi:signal peptidase I
MKLVRNILIGLGLVGFSLACLAVVLFNKPTWGWQALSIPTGSMRPHVPPGSLVLVHHVPSSSLRVGDVITYINPRTHKGTITHRIIKSYSVGGRIPAYITQGDANPSADAPVIGGLVQGKMVWHVPYLGQVLMWAKTWVGIAVLVYLPCLLMMIAETRKLNAYWKRFKPYSLLNATNPYRQAMSLRRLSATGGMAAIAVAMLFGLGLTSVSALQDATSNAVTLGPNTLTVTNGGGGSQSDGSTTTVTCTNTTDVHVNNSSSQSATSGNATSAGNTTGGSATGGATTNTNTSSTSVTVTNGSC